MSTNELYFWGRLRRGEMSDSPRGLHSKHQHSLFSTCFILSLYSLLKAHWHCSVWRQIKKRKQARCVAQCFLSLLQCIMGMTSNLIWPMCAIPHWCCYFSTDGSNQSHCQTVCRHSGRQLPDNWAETSWQFGKEVHMEVDLDNDNMWLFLYPQWFPSMCLH